MTPEQRQRVLHLVDPRARPDDLLSAFKAADGESLGFDLLSDAFRRSDPVDVEVAMIVCFTFGFSARHLPLLIDLCVADWHQRHEDVVTALGKLRSPDAVDALLRAATWVPEYLQYDEHRALARNAIWALGKTPGDAAELALEQLSKDASEIVREGASAQLARRRSGTPDQMR